MNAGTNDGFGAGVASRRPGEDSVVLLNNDDGARRLLDALLEPWAAWAPRPRSARPALVLHALGHGFLVARGGSRWTRRQR